MLAWKWGGMGMGMDMDMDMVWVMGNGYGSLYGSVCVRVSLCLPGPPLESQLS